jgi:hypothetical protein
MWVLLLNMIHLFLELVTALTNGSHLQTETFSVLPSSVTGTHAHAHTLLVIRADLLVASKEAVQEVNANTSSISARHDQKAGQH